MLGKNLFSGINMPPAKTVLSTAASIAASAMVLRSIAHDLVPYELRQYIFLNIQSLFRSISPEMELIIEEFDGIASNQIYKAAEVYLGAKISPSTQRFKVSLGERETKISTSMSKNQEIMDIFNGVRFKWRQITRQVESKTVMYPGLYSSSVSQSEVRCFELSFHKKHKDMVFSAYFPFIMEESKNVKEEKKTLKIYTLNSEHTRRYSGAGYPWSSVNLHHPATFDTLAMDADLKRKIMEDLQRFVKRREYYKRVGKAWKRGYLLYGPPGTGKSSLIAAMANYLNFDVYDLELTSIHANSELRSLLIATANRSILVVEDIDCSLELQDRQAEAEALNVLRSNQASQAQTVNIIRKHKPNQVTLSGLLNFIDGLWSSCGDERIIVFTTNHKERLDPALLRPGRMDVHIHMSYCTPCSFKTLAANYLGLEEHCMFSEVEHLLENTMVTPAEVGEQLLKEEEPETALQGLIEFLQAKKKENEDMRASRSKQEQGREELGTESESSKEQR